MDLNHILLFIACLAPLILLSQSWRKGGLDRGWRLAAIVVLIVTAISWLWHPETAGFVGGGAWLVLMFLPAIGLRKASDLIAQQRYAFARRLVSTLRFIHPAGDLNVQSELLRAMEFAQRGDFASAQALLGKIGKVETSVGRRAIAQSYRIGGDWQGLLGSLHGRGGAGTVWVDLTLLPLYLRALGETGARDQLVQEFTHHAEDIRSVPQYHLLYDNCLMVLLAFGGRVQALAQLFKTRLRKLSNDTRTFWMGTAELAAGKLQPGREQLEDLRANGGDALIRMEAGRRLERAEELGRLPLAPVSEALLRQIKPDVRPSTRVFGTRAAWPTPAVLVLIGLNLAMFVAEMVLGGSTDPETLHRLGALDFFSVLFAHEYWRLITSLFLHFGPLHLLFNLYALSVIGPGLEEAIGAVRFGICYLLSGLGSSAGVLALHLLRFTRTEQLVGASGCVMGLVGVWAGLLLRHRDAPQASRRLKNILVIVAIQTAFDLSTPQISMAAHMSGLLTGVVLGLFVSPRRLPGE